MARKSHLVLVEEFSLKCHSIFLVFIYTFLVPLSYVSVIFGTFSFFMFSFSLLRVFVLISPLHLSPLKNALFSQHFFAFLIKKKCKIEMEIVKLHQRKLF